MDHNGVLIIRELLATPDDFVSGSQLAELIGVSRVSIHSYMEKLRSQGFDFEAVRSKGYRIVARPETLNETLLQAMLTHASSSLSATVLDASDSTNAEAERRLANGDPTPFVVVARQQLAGRGRMGRVWHSPASGNLYASYAFRPQVSPSGMALFTLWMGLNLCECLQSLCRVQCGVKWPNDLHIGGKKVAGILTEARMETDLVRDVVLGIGINVNIQASDWPPELASIATSLRHEANQTFDLNRLAAAISGRVMIAYHKFLEGEHRVALKEKWPLYDTLQGQTVSLMQGASRVSGIARGIDATGALQIERPDGTRFQARAGEVTLEKPSQT